MPYTKHIEFVAFRTDVHPQSGESKSKTIIDAYFYPDRIDLMGWGTNSALSPMPRDELVAIMKEDGFKVFSED